MEMGLSREIQSHFFFCIHTAHADLLEEIASLPYAS
jgi:hypothetical protein